MSFLKIDTAKRDKLIKDYLVRKKLVRDRLLAERAGDIELQQDLTKFFRPITKSQREVQEEATKKITEELGGIREKTDLLPQIKEGIEQLPERLPQQLIPEEEEVGYTILDKKYDELREKYGKKEIDTTFGIKKKGINYYIGDKMVDYDGDGIWIGAERYKSTEGLWRLIMTKNPTNFDDNDIANYEKILRNTNVIFTHNDPIKKKS